MNEGQPNLVEIPIRIDELKLVGNVQTDAAFVLKRMQALHNVSNCQEALAEIGNCVSFPYLHLHHLLGLIW